MDDRAAEDTRDQVKEKSFDLHVLFDDKAEEPEHVGTDQKLGNSPSSRLLLARQDRVKTQTDKDCYADIAEVEEEKMFPFTCQKMTAIAPNTSNKMKGTCNSLI